MEVLHSSIFPSSYQKAKEFEEQKSDFLKMKKNLEPKHHNRKVKVVASFQKRRKRSFLDFDPRLLLSKSSPKSHSYFNNLSSKKFNVMQILDFLLNDDKLDKDLKEKLRNAKVKMIQINAAIEQDSANTGKKVQDTINRIKTFKVIKINVNTLPFRFKSYRIKIRSVISVAINLIIYFYRLFWTRIAANVKYLRINSIYCFNNN